MAQVIESGMERLGSWLCRLLHDSPSWPIHNHYACRTCGRLYQVRW